jgi:integral membrane protein (TIGR01906 family)
MRVAKVAAYWLFALCFPFLLLTNTIHFGANSIHIYEYGFDKYEISEVTGIDRTQLSEVARRLVDYFDSKAETPQIMVVNTYGKEFELFHDYELIHLQDVKGLFQLNYRVQVVSLAYVIIYALLFLLWKRGRWQDLAKGIRRGCALTLVLIAVLGIASIFGFEQLFIRFHHLAFTNPYWMLDPSKDYLIMLFPAGFWQDIAFLGGATTVAEALLFGGIAWAVPWIRKMHSC